MRENGVDSPYLFLHCSFSIVRTENASEEKEWMVERLGETRKGRRED